MPGGSGVPSKMWRLFIATWSCGHLACALQLIKSAIRLNFVWARNKIWSHKLNGPNIISNNKVNGRLKSQ